MIHLKQGDTKTAVRATLLKKDGTPVNLTGCTVLFIMQGMSLTERQVEIEDAVQGIVLIVFEAEDTSQPGRFKAEIEVIYGDGRKETFPNEKCIPVSIESNLKGGN